ncbi:hypothetical protein [Kribbella flavida]|nr:hypothetical protein [Kribbella flavida]
MSGRRVGTAMLTGGLLVITLLGGAGGYGLGHLTQPESRPSSTASPLRPSDGTPSPSEPVNTAVPDPTPALRKSTLRYKTRAFTAESVVRSHVTAEVPRNWRMTQPDPMTEGRFTDPTGKRWVRIEAGFTIQRPPAASMAVRIEVLGDLPVKQAVRIISKQVSADKRSATLTYTYIPDRTLRYVVVRWVALDRSGNCAVEISSTGLQQDKDAIWDVLDHVSNSVTRSDSSL